MFQRTGFIILLVIASFALEQLEAKPHIIHPKIILKDIQHKIAVAAIKKDESIKASGAAIASIATAPIKIANNIISIKAHAVKAAAALKVAAVVKGAALVKGAAVVKGAAIVKGITALKGGKLLKGGAAAKGAAAIKSAVAAVAGAGTKGAAALTTYKVALDKKPVVIESDKKAVVVESVKQKEVLPEIAGVVKKAIAGIIRPAPLISVEANKPLLHSAVVAEPISQKYSSNIVAHPILPFHSTNIVADRITPIHSINIPANHLPQIEEIKVIERVPHATYGIPNFK